MYACVFACVYIPYNYIKASGMFTTCFKIKTFSASGETISLEYFWNLMNTLEQVNKFGCTSIENLLSNSALLNFLVIDILSILLSKPRCYNLVAIIFYRIFIAFIIAYFIYPLINSKNLLVRLPDLELSTESHWTRRGCAEQFLIIAYTWACCYVSVCVS